MNPVFNVIIMIVSFYQAKSFFFCCSAPNKKKKNLEKEGEIKVSVDNGFEKGWTAEEILGATETLGELYFLIKW